MALDIRPWAAQLARDLAARHNLNPTETARLTARLAIRLHRHQYDLHPDRHYKARRRTARIDNADWTILFDRDAIYLFGTSIRNPLLHWFGVYDRNRQLLLTRTGVYPADNIRTAWLTLKSLPALPTDAPQAAPTWVHKGLPSPAASCSAPARTD